MYVFGSYHGCIESPLQETPQMVRDQIPHNINLPATKTNGEMIGPKIKSSQNEEVVGIERLKMAAGGPCLDREFGDFLECLIVSLIFNHFSYKKAVDNNINFLRVVLVTRQMFREKRIMVNVNDSRADKCMQVSLYFLRSRRASELDIFINKVKVMS
ncbi:hypothetical protein AgCh_021122 [Apium graveolens]